MIKRSISTIVAAVSFFGLVSLATPSSAQQIWSSPGLGSEQFAPQHTVRTMGPRLMFAHPQRRLELRRVCGMLTCQFREVWVNE